MDMVEYLPLGSIVVLEGGVKKVMIIGRGLLAKMNGDTLFFDYGGVQYPEGLTGDQMAYFNHKGITEIVFRGYSDEDDQRMVKGLNLYAERSKVKKMSSEEIVKMNEEQNRQQ